MELSIQDVWLLIYKAGPVRAALTNLLVVLWWPHLAQGGEQHPGKMADTEMGSRCACACPRPGESFKAVLLIESPKPRLGKDLKSHVAQLDA